MSSTRLLPITLGEAMDGTLARLKATGNPSDSWIALNELAAKAWAPLRGTRLPALRRAQIEDMINERAEKHRKSAKIELEFLKRVLREAKARGQRVDPAIFEIPAVKHKPRPGRALTVTQLYEFACWFPEHVSRMILLAGMVGPRQKVWFNLTDAMLDLKARTMTIPAWLAKSRREHTIYFNDLEAGLVPRATASPRARDAACVPDGRREAVDGKPLPRSRLAQRRGGRREERS